MMKVEIIFIPGSARVLLRLILPVILVLLCFQPVQAKEFSMGTQEEAKMVDARATESPGPEIPEELKSEAFKSAVTARFSIAADGKFSVKLIDSSGNEEIDRLVLATLKKWKFKPATVDDKPVASNRKLKIELEIE